MAMAVLTGCGRCGEPTPPPPKAAEPVVSAPAKQAAPPPGAKAAPSGPAHSFTELLALSGRCAQDPACTSSLASPPAGGTPEASAGRACLEQLAAGKLEALEVYPAVSDRACVFALEGPGSGRLTELFAPDPSLPAPAPEDGGAEAQLREAGDHFLRWVELVEKARACEGGGPCLTEGLAPRVKVDGAVLPAAELVAQGGAARLDQLRNCLATFGSAGAQGLRLASAERGCECRVLRSADGWLLTQARCAR